jgi:hypothetical protein
MSSTFIESHPVEVSNAAGELNEMEQRARHSRQMVRDLEIFLSIALARPANETGHYPWPLRYNSPKTGLGGRLVNED